MTAHAVVAKVLQQLAAVEQQPVYELRDAHGCRWMALRMPTFREIEALREEVREDGGQTMVLTRDRVTLATFHTGALVSVCAWCADVAEQTEAAHADGHEVTHGICDACRVKWEAGHVAR